MRLIATNTATSEWPKRHCCDNCGAELEYDEADVHVGWMGCEYVTCPNCNCETMLDGKRVMPPTWKVTFDHTCAENGAVDVFDHKVREYVSKAAKAAKVLCPDEYKSGEFYATETGNLLIVGLKWNDGIDIYVTKDYWKDSIAPDDYGMVK